MKTRRFGPTGEEVSVIGLGGMPMSILGRPSEAQSIATIHAALDAGMTWIDTADVYCLDDGDLGHNERVIARALASWSGPRERVRVATKGGLRRPHGDWVNDGSPELVTAACERSLRALGVERIWLYQLHAPPEDGRIEDTVAALARLRDEGKIEHIGLSNVSVPEIEASLRVAPIVSVQNRCNLLDRRAFDQGVVACCEQRGLAFLPYSPVGGGRGRVRLGEDRRLVEVARKHGRTPYEIALAWLLSESDSMFPIPGASRPENARSSATAAEIVLDAQDLRALA